VVRFETNSLTPTNVTDDMIEKLKTFGYTSFEREGDNIVAKYRRQLNEIPVNRGGT